MGYDLEQSTVTDLDEFDGIQEIVLVKKKHQKKKRNFKLKRMDIV